MFSLLLLLCAVVPTIAHPVYPLYAIDSFSMKLAPDDYKIIAQNFTHIQGWYTTDELKQFKQASADFAPVWYIQTGICGFSALESAGRMNTSFYLTGTLNEDLNPAMETFSYHPLQNVSALKPSNISADASTNKGYVTFIRIGAEIMKLVGVTQAKEATSHLSVVRGFDNTQSTEHKKGEKIFAPIYHSFGYPGGVESLTYMVDVTQQLSVDMLVNHTVTAVQNGYAGSWFDCFSCRPFQPVDMGGKRAEAWNFVEGDVYTKNEYIEDQRVRLNRVYNESRKILGHEPVVLANNAVCYFTGNCKLLLENGTYSRPLDGYSIEGFSGHEDTTDPVHGCDPTKLSLRYPDIGEWMKNVGILMDAAKNKLAAFPMIAQAGCKSVYLEIIGNKNPEVRDKFENFSYGTYLLGVESPDGPTRLGLPAFYRNGTTRYAYVHPRYNLDIGAPQMSAKNVSEYQIQGHKSFARPFTKGLVVVNPYNETDAKLQLNGSFYDPVKKEMISDLAPEGQTGYILTKS